MRVVTTQEIRHLEERLGSLYQCPEEERILTAGRNSAHAILEWTAQRCPFLPEKSTFWILAGSGKNGADAWVAAETLARAGKTVCLADFSAEKRPPIPKCLGNEVTSGKLFPVWDMADPPLQAMMLDALETGDGICIDGLVGIGLHGPLRENLQPVVTSLQLRRIPIISLDIPSGLDADTGKGTLVVPADLTLTMGCVKQGMLLNRGLE